MKLNSSHSVYRRHDVACSPTQLVIMLLDAATRYCHEAVGHMKAERWVEKGNAIESAHACLTELRHTLDRSAGGSAAESVDRMYDFLGAKLLLANVNKDVSQIEQVVQSLALLRQSWNDLFDKLKVEGKLSDSEAVTPVAASAV